MINNPLIDRRWPRDARRLFETGRIAPFGYELLITYLGNGVKTARLAPTQDSVVLSGVRLIVALNSSWQLQGILQAWWRERFTTQVLDCTRTYLEFMAYTEESLNG